MNKLRELIEIEFLKSKTYEEINDMFNMLNDKLNASLEENKRLQEHIKTLESNDSTK